MISMHDSNQEVKMSDKVIEVVAAAIIKDGYVFCCQRDKTRTLAHYWEFPGGKIEEGETKQEALIREIQEELDTEIEILEFINTAQYTYDFGTVKLSVFTAKVIQGELKLKEHQDAKWVPYSELNQLNWAPVDIEAVNILSKNNLISD